MKKILILSVLLFLILMVFIHPEILQAQEYKTIIDMSGRKVKVPAGVDRIVALGPGVLRQIVYLTSVDKVVGVENIEKEEITYTPYNMANPELKGLPSVGPHHGGEAELILSVNPEVLFYWGDTEGAENLQLKTGIPVIVLQYGDILNNRDTLFHCWEIIGNVLDKQERVRELKNYTESLIKTLEERTADVKAEKKPSVYAGGFNARGSHGIVSTKIPFPPLSFINANSVTDSLNYRTVTSVMLDREQLLLWNPEIMFLDNINIEVVKNDLKRFTELKLISAVKNGNTYGIMPYSYYHNNYATILVNAYYMAKVIYPERFADIEIAKKADEIYSQFTGNAVYEKMVERFGKLRKININ